MKSYPCLPHVLERSLSDMIFGGVLERYPSLKIISAENDIGWIGHYLQRMDHAYEKYQYLEKGAVIPSRPASTSSARCTPPFRTTGSGC